MFDLSRQVLRQLASKTGTVAHEREVKALAVSKDIGLLVSGSADSTLKIWNLDNDSLQLTLSGHRDEVRLSQPNGTFIIASHVIVLNNQQ